MHKLITPIAAVLVLAGCVPPPPTNTVRTPPLDTAKIRQNTTQNTAQNNTKPPVYAHYPDPNAPVYDHGYDRLNRSGPSGVIGGSGSGVYVGLGAGISSQREVRSGQDYRGPSQLDYGGRLNR